MPFFFPSQLVLKRLTVNAIDSCWRRTIAKKDDHLEAKSLCNSIGINDLYGEIIGDMTEQVAKVIGEKSFINPLVPEESCRHYELLMKIKEAENHMHHY